MSFKLSDRSQERMVGIDPRLIAIVKLAIRITRVDFGIPATGGIRTARQQQALFDRRVSKCDGIVRTSYHQTGRAVDVYAYVDGSASWSESDLTLVACAMLQAAAELGHPLKWGGLWPTWQDRPHFELSE